VAEAVLVMLTESGGAQLPAAALEALGLGARIAAQFGASWDAALLDGDANAEEVAERGAGRLLAATARPDTGEGLYEAAVVAFERTAPRIVVLSRGAHLLEIMPRLAARTGGGCVSGVTEFRTDTDRLLVVASVYGGAARAVFGFQGEGPRIMSGAPGVASAPDRQRGRTVEVERFDVPPARRVKVVQPLQAPEGPRLEDAHVVVSGGRGLRQAANYALVEELAAALGGMAGASRAIVDDGWAPASKQVGLTGKIVTPDLYVAAGISGASQHMAGCSNARKLVAINTDPNAPIFRYADYGIVDDCLAVLPALIELAKAGAGRA